MPRFGDVSGGSLTVDEVDTPTASTEFSVGKATRVAPSVAVTSLLPEAPADGSRVVLLNEGTATQTVSAQGSDTIEGVATVPPKTQGEFKYSTTGTKWAAQHIVSEVYEVTLADLQAATMVKDGSFVTQSSGLAAGSNGGIAVTHRNQTAAAANGTGEYTLFLIPLLDLLPNCPIDIQGGATGAPCQVWAQAELVDYDAADDDIIGGVGFLEYDAPTVGVSTCWTGVRTFTSGTQARAYLSGSSSSSAGATLSGFTPGTDTVVAVAQRTIYVAPDGVTAQNSPTRSMVWNKTDGTNNDGGNYWDAPVFGAGTAYVAVGFGQESATDSGNRTLEYKFRVGWSSLPPDIDPLS